MNILGVTIISIFWWHSQFNCVVYGHSSDTAITLTFNYKNILRLQFNRFRFVIGSKYMVPLMSLSNTTFLHTQNDYGVDISNKRPKAIFVTTVFALTFIRYCNNISFNYKCYELSIIESNVSWYGFIKDCAKRLEIPQ